MTRFTPSVLIFGILVCVILPFSYGGQPIDGFAAEVDGKVITVGDVVQHIRRELAGLSQRFRGEDLKREQAKMFGEGLEDLIEKQLIVAKFKKLGAQLQTGAVRERADQLMRQQFDDDRVTFQNALVAAGTTEQEWKDTIEEQLIIQSMNQQFVRSNIHVAPREIRSAYEEKKADLTVPVELELYAIAFRPVPEEEADQRQQKIEQVLDQLEAGEDFIEVAKTYSEGPRADQGGYQGWMRVETLPTPLPEKLRPLQPGDRTGLLDTATQSYLFLVKDRRGGETMPLAQAQPAIEKEIRAEKADQIYNAWMEGLRDEFQVLRYNPDISAVTGEN